MSKLTNRKKKRAAKATGKPYQKPTRTKKGLPGEGLIKAARKIIPYSVGTAMAATVATSIKPSKSGPFGGSAAGAAQALVGVGVGKIGFKRKEAARNQPGTTTTKKKRKGRITKTRHVTPKGVTRTKTKKYKR